MRLPTPHTSAPPLVCNEFHEGRSYTNRRPHGSGDWLLILTCGGAGLVTLSTGSRCVLPGDAVLFSPGAAQDYRTAVEPGYWHLRWAHFQPQPHWRTWLRWPPLGSGVGLVSTRGQVDGPVQAALGRMLTAQRLGGPSANALALNALEEALIWIYRQSADSDMVGVDTRVQQAVQYLVTYTAEPFNLANLAAHCGLSGSRLNHLFQAELGTTPQRFGEKVKLDLASQLLTQTNLSIAEVAQEVGFADPLYFSRRFHRAFGHAPSAHRNKSQSKLNR